MQVGDVEMEEYCLLHEVHEISGWMNPLEPIFMPLKTTNETSLPSSGWRPLTSTAGDMGLIPGWGNILYAAWRHGQQEQNPKSQQQQFPPSGVKSLK